MILRDRFGSTIGRLRVARGLSQEKLAHLSGLHATTISAIERGKMSVTLETLEGLARGLGARNSAPAPAAHIFHCHRTHVRRLFGLLSRPSRCAAQCDSP